jgi:DNA-binding response OmpR family regulator
LGALDFVSKPESFAELEQILKSILTNQRKSLRSI